MRTKIAFWGVVLWSFITALSVALYMREQATINLGSAVFGGFMTIILFIDYLLTRLQNFIRDIVYNTRMVELEEWEKTT